jgi:hypothetical protein
VQIAIEIPDLLYRRLEARASSHGTTVESLIGEAIVAKALQLGSPPWMKGFGKLRHLREDIREIERVISAEFSRIEPEDLD